MGFPGWELGWICWNELLVLTHLSDYRPSSSGSQDTLRKAYVTQYIAICLPGREDTLRKAYVTPLPSTVFRVGRTCCVKPT
ncbi:hypothetical protein Hanom_Chr06g00485211 [Helianthus anomalus]